MDKNKKFTIRDQFGYAMGDAGGSFVNLYIDSYFMIFCTYVLHISPYFMGVLFLIARLWDAINDPIIGSFPDRWLIGKSGDRFKPYIKVFMIPLAIAGVMCYTNVAGLSDTAKYVWVSVSYILYGMCYTGTSMPFGSLASVITADPVERTKLSRARSIGAMITGVGLAVIPMLIWTDNPDGTQSPVPQAYFLIAIVFGILSILCYCLMLANTTERIKYQTNPKGYSYKRVLAGVFKNRPLIGAMVAVIGSMITITGSSQFGSYLFKEYYQQPQVVSLLGFVQMGVMLVLFPILPNMVKKFGKKNALMIPISISFVVAIFLFFVPIENVWVFFILNSVATMGNYMFNMMVWALVTDCLDYQEYITGERADGSVYSIFTFARKIGSALASTLASFSLGWIGYDESLTTQTVEVANRIRYLCTALPVATGLLLILGLGIIYNLSKADTEKISAELAVRHAQEAEN